MCLQVVPRPLKGNNFYHYFKILIILAQNAEPAKKFQVQNFVIYGNKHQSLTRKIGFRVISSFIIDWLASKILIFSTRPILFSFIAHHYGFSRNFNILNLELSGHRNSTIFNLPCQPWAVLTFEQVISLCWNFQDNLISYIPFIWNSFIRI